MSGKRFQLTLSLLSDNNFPHCIILEISMQTKYSKVYSHCSIGERFQI